MQKLYADSDGYFYKLKLSSKLKVQKSKLFPEYQVNETNPNSLMFSEARDFLAVLKTHWWTNT